MQSQPLESLKQQFQPVGIKLLNEYNVKYTTHVVSKKRNTAKGLQALVNGKYIVTESFLDAVLEQVSSKQAEDGTETSALEQNFDQNWPDAMQHLPPRGAEPFDHPDSIYSPDAGRQDVFEGYTFVFYDQTQYNNLLAPITNASGKALLEDVVPDKTTVDDFVRYVKGVADEKGLGSFEDGSEGKGVVLVRYLPSKGDFVQWYADFFTAVSIRLDHRPIEQNEFLEAILIKDASMLRRALEVEELPATTAEPAQRAQSSPEVGSQTNSVANGSSTRRGRARAPIKRRFAGFDDDADITMDDIQPNSAPAEPTRTEPEAGLFVSQEPDLPNDGIPDSPKKRSASSLQDDDLMEGMAPAVARFKRQRIARGEDFASATPEPEEKPVPAKPAPKKKKELDILAEAARHREQEEAQARAEKEDLARLPDDIDLAEIRRLNIVEEVEVKIPGNALRTREQDIADGRWDPKWNGVKNFKKFRRRGEATGRQPARVIVSLTEIKAKEFGVGDKYWLEDEEQPKKPSQTNSSAGRREEAMPATEVSLLDDDDDSQPVKITRRRGATTQPQASRESQSSTRTSQSLGKRSAPQASSETQASKRQRPATRVEVQDSDSDDELRFRFGRRR